MSGFSKHGIILTSLFSVLFLAVLSYLLWRRRQQIHRSRIEPTGVAATSNTIPRASFHSEIFKLGGIYGSPSRVLFTIKEEEKEEIENELASEKKASLSLVEHFDDFQLQLAAGVSPSPEVVVVVCDSNFEVELSFLTPCSSPPFFTPLSSPTREKNQLITGRQVNVLTRE